MKRDSIAETKRETEAIVRDLRERDPYNQLPQWYITDLAELAHSLGMDAPTFIRASVLVGAHRLSVMEHEAKLIVRAMAHYYSHPEPVDDDLPF